MSLGVSGAACVWVTDRAVTLICVMFVEDVLAVIVPLTVPAAKGGFAVIRSSNSLPGLMILNVGRKDGLLLTGS